MAQQPIWRYFLIQISTARNQVIFMARTKVDPVMMGRRTLPRVKHIRPKTHTVRLVIVVIIIPAGIMQ